MADGADSTISRRALIGGAVAAGTAAVPGRARAGWRSTRQEAAKITFALSADDLAEVQPLLDDYTSATGVTFETRAFPYASLYENLNINLTQATGVFDVVSLDDPWMPLFAGGRFLMDLTALMEGKGLGPDPDFVPELLALGEFPAETGLRGIPWIGNVQVFARRTDVFEELGLTPPATWDDVLTTAQVITEARSGQDLFGIGLRG